MGGIDSCHMALPTQPVTPVPPQRLRFMNEDDAKFLHTGQVLASTLYAHGLGPGSRLLDVGSGYGRLAVGLMSSGYSGRYLGFDILRRHVRWCRQNLTADPRYGFAHLDVVNARYNPDGTIPAAEARFPAPDGSRDYCALFSVFTHFYADDIRRYLAEIRRVLVPGGLAATTWFLFDDARLPAVTGERSAFRLVHQLDDVTRYETPADPLKAIGYEESFMRRLAEEAGLEVVSVTRGSWAGDQPPEQYQDLVVLRRRVLGRD
ncbi:methyltransferase [Nocardioides psychrotolerans]|nr:methyltransferase [Nocardioides psychrotolerans]